MEKLRTLATGMVKENQISKFRFLELSKILTDNIICRLHPIRITCSQRLRLHTIEAQSTLTIIPQIIQWIRLRHTRLLMATFPPVLTIKSKCKDITPRLGQLKVIFSHRNWVPQIGKWTLPQHNTQIQCRLYHNSTLTLKENTDHTREPTNLPRIRTYIKVVARDQITRLFQLEMEQITEDVLIRRLRSDQQLST